MTLPLLPPLPIDDLLPGILASLRTTPRLVLSAPPGSGKTTRLPRALLDGGFADLGEIIVLEPRKIAARLSAKRVAEELGEKLGERVGYTVRFDDTSSPRTRIRFVTEGVLTRRLLSDPTLQGVAAVLLDEFHERHLQGDLALALLRQLTRTTRPDLVIVAMSATLSTEALTAFLDAPVLEGGTRPFPVTLEHVATLDDRPLQQQVAAAARRALSATDEGHVLVFLPGAAEIRRAREACAGLAAQPGVEVWTLHGDLSGEEQDAAVAASSARKIILSTNLAESSVTIPGVRAVIDSGLSRIATTSPWTGFNELRTVPISQASAVQRAGRAGRTHAGFALRLYPLTDFMRRPEHDAPEIARIDLAETALQLLSLGFDPKTFAFFEAPPTPQLDAALTLLGRLGATDRDGAITPLGRKLLRFPLPPRLARFVIHADEAGAGPDAVAIAALLSERPIRKAQTFGGGRRKGTASHDSDAIARLADLEELVGAGFPSWLLTEGGFDGPAARSVARTAKALERALPSGRRGGRSGENHEIALRKALLAAYGDRVAKRRKPGSKELVLSSGGTAVQGDESEVHEAGFVVVLDVAQGMQQRVGSAAQAVTATVVSAIEPEWLLELFPERIRDDKQVVFVAAKERVEVVERLLYDAIVLDETQKRGNPDDPDVARALAQAALAKGLGAFSDDPERVERFLERARFVASLDPSFPSFEGETMERVMTEVCRGRTSFAELRDGSLAYALEAVLTAEQRRRLNEWAPDGFELPSGKRARITYPPGQAPWAESRLQDCFGWAKTPIVGGGRVALLLHLLAPNKRAVQVTTDLAGFWQRTYPTIKKELARKYPRHAWPDDPTIPAPPMRPRPPRV